MSRFFTVILSVLAFAAMALSMTACCGGGGLEGAEARYRTNMDNLDVAKSKVKKKDKDDVEDKIKEFRKEYGNLSSDVETRTTQLNALNTRIRNYTTRVDPSSASSTTKIKSGKDKDKDKKKDRRKKDRRKKDKKDK